MTQRLRTLLIGMICLFGGWQMVFGAAIETGITIDAGYADYDMKTGTYHHGGHVVVDAPGVLLLTSEDLVAQMAGGSTNNPAPVPSTASSTNSSTRISVLTARTNVVIDVIQLPAGPGGVTNTMRFFCDTAVYTATNEVVILTGSPRMEGGPVQQANAEIMVYNLATGRLRVTSYHATLKAGLLKDQGLFKPKTNSAAIKSK